MRVFVSEKMIEVYVHNTHAYKNTQTHTDRHTHTRISDARTMFRKDNEEDYQRRSACQCRGPSEIAA